MVRPADNERDPHPAFVEAAFEATLLKKPVSTPPTSCVAPLSLVKIHHEAVRCYPRYLVVLTA